MERVGPMDHAGPIEQPSDRREEHQPQEREYRREYQNPEYHQPEYQEHQETSKSSEYSSKSPEAQPVTPGAASSGPPRDRRESEEWDAAKVPPSRFQKRKGSIFATPSTRDGHCNTNTFEKYYAKVAEMRGRRLSHFDPTNPPQTK